MEDNNPVPEVAQLREALAFAGDCALRVREAQRYRTDGAYQLMSPYCIMSVLRGLDNAVTMLWGSREDYGDVWWRVFDALQRAHTTLLAALSYGDAADNADQEAHNGAEQQSDGCQ